MKFLDSLGVTALVTRLKTYFALKSEASKVVVTQILGSGTRIADIRVDGATTQIYAQNDKVTQEVVVSSTHWRPLLLGFQNNASEGFTPSNTTNYTVVNTNFKVQPSTGTISAPIFKGNLTGTASGNVESCHGSASAGGSVTFNIGNGFRGVLVVQGASSTTNGMYMVWASGSGAITSYDVRAASSVTFSTTTGKMTITAPSSTGIHCMWYITYGTVSVA